MNYIKLLIISSLLMVTIGCASITRGSKDTLVINSDPSGAKVSLSIGLSGKTPCAFKVSRKGGFVVKIEKEGYETVEIQVLGQISGGGAAGMAGNVLLGGIIGAGVDAATGAAKDLKPNPIDVKLVPIKQDDKPTGQTNIEGKEINLKLSIVESGDHYLLSVVQS
ncbi:PEGA domain-containing protein [bacterium]|nr:PEGA domain-containing protein [bacterium]